MQPLRILLIAYEFPPFIAAQSLRWLYLANELAKLDVKVEVLCPDVNPIRKLSASLHSNILTHRIWPGPYVFLSQLIAAKNNFIVNSDEIAKPSVKAITTRSIHNISRFCLNHLLYPDWRTEWYPFAKYYLNHLLRQNKYDVIISSHEPGVDVLLGMWAKKNFSIKWVVDLGDPLLTPYSPKWRRWIDKRYEAKAINYADHVVVTNPEIIKILAERHGVSANKITCVSQGYELLSPPTVARPKNKKMHIVYTGTFYEKFRNPMQFAAALNEISNQNITITIAGKNDNCQHLFRKFKNVKFTGKIDHYECLELQRQADILLNIGNEQSYQVPGKFFEYLGTGKPILHIQTSTYDPVSELIRGLNAGEVVLNNPDAIKASLLMMLENWKNNRLERLYNVDGEKLDAYSWTSLARRYYLLLKQLSC